MYQLEVKQYLVELMFNPSDGWKVTVDIDAMELAKGLQQKDGKKQRVVDAEKKLNEKHDDKIILTDIQKESGLNLLTNPEMLSEIENDINRINAGSIFLVVAYFIPIIRIEVKKVAIIAKINHID